jgi:integrase
MVDNAECSDYRLTMASLVKDLRGRSPYWICCYTSADGRRLKKSTKQKDRRSAMEVCLALECAENAAKSGTLTEQRTKELLGQVLERVTGEPLQNFTIKEWFSHWLELKAKVRGERTIERYRQVIRDFIVTLGNRANLAVTHLSSRDVLNYRDGLRASKRTERTANQSVGVISAALRTAMRQQHIVSNPALAVENLKVRAAQKGVFTLEQVCKLLAAAKGDWRGAILFAFHTGARLSDVARMRWESIDLAGKWIRFTPSKTNKPLEIPLHRELERELLKKPGVGKAFLFPELAAVKGTGGHGGLSGRFKAIMEKASIIGVIKQRDDGSRAVHALSFHSFRHTFASLLTNKGVNEETRMKLTGHSTRDAHAGYTHHEAELLRAAIEVIPDVDTSIG